MTLDEAIEHAEEVASTNERLCETVQPAMQLSDYGKCAAEHRQLAEWLKELKRLREQMSWTPTSEQPPKENGNYLAFYRSGDGTADLEFMMVDHCNAGGGWLHEVRGKKLYKEVVAWMPLPKPYKAKTKECKNCEHYTDAEEIHGVTPCGSCGVARKNFEEKRQQA